MSKTVALEYECNFSVTSVMEFLFEMSKLVRFLAENQHDLLMYFIVGFFKKAGIKFSNLIFNVKN